LFIVVAMETSDSLARLLRLRGAIERSLEDPATIDAFSADGLKNSYQRLRAQARELVMECEVDADEFDSLFPEKATAERTDVISIAKAVASLLRQLDGYLGGIVQTQVINAQLTLEQLELAREAARSPFGFG
jgi:hypothetical protein